MHNTMVSPTREQLVIDDNSVEVAFVVFLNGNDRHLPLQGPKAQTLAVMSSDLTLSIAITALDLLRAFRIRHSSSAVICLDSCISIIPF